MKTKKTIPPSKPRNMLVQHAMFRKAGSHKRTNKQERAAQRSRNKGEE